MIDSTLSIGVMPSKGQVKAVAKERIISMSGNSWRIAVNPSKDSETVRFIFALL